MPLKVLVIASAKPGKEHRLRELAAWVSGEIKAAEPHISEYEIYMADGDEAGTKDGVVIMHIKDEESLAERRGMKHHKEFAAKMKEEDILRKPLVYLKLTDTVADWHR